MAIGYRWWPPFRRANRNLISKSINLTTFVQLLILFSCTIYSLEMLDKMEPPQIPDGYGISIAYACLLDIVRSISLAVEGPSTVTILKFDRYWSKNNKRKTKLIIS